MKDIKRRKNKNENKGGNKNLFKMISYQECQQRTVINTHRHMCLCVFITVRYYDHLVHVFVFFLFFYYESHRNSYLSHFIVSEERLFCLLVSCVLARLGGACLSETVDTLDKIISS